MTTQKKFFSILIVEDSKTQAYQLAHLIENSGYSVTLVHNGNDALDVIKYNPPSLVVTDIVMPGMNGYELCAAIRSNDAASGIPVILLTSLASPQDIISALECGADDFVSKPYDDDFLILKLDRFFNRPQQNISRTDNIETEEVVYSGKSYQISVNRQKMLDLMISAYEATIQKNRELLETQEALVDTNMQLGITVIDKDKALEDVRIKEEILSKWNTELNIMNRLGSVINQSGTIEELLSGVAGELMNSGLCGICYGVEIRLNEENGDMVKSLEYAGGDKPESILKNDEQGLSSSHSHISVLLMARERKIGVLNLTTGAGSDPDEHLGEMLISLGKQLGMAIENLNLLTETKRLSLQDPLTGLANRRMIDITLETQMARANRYKDHFCLIMLDIDHFKQYNDKFGHDEGDRILLALSGYLKENVRDTDLAARFGGEEFIVIISEIGIKDIYKIAERHRVLIQECTGVTVSMGVAEYKFNQTADELIKSADQALYRAKENGRNRVEMAD